MSHHTIRATRYDGLIRITLLNSVTREGLYLDLNIGEALDFADDLNKLACRVTA